MAKSRLRWLGFVCGTVAWFYVAAAQAGDVGGYLRLDGGIHFAEDVSLDVGGLPGEMKLDPGFRVDLGLGYDLNRWVTLELEVGYFDNSAESVSLGHFSEHMEDTWLHGVPVLGNVRLQYRNRTDFVPYIGAGAGGIASMLSINNDSDTDFVFAYQITAGLIYLLDERGWIDVGYKYFSTADSSYGIGGFDVEASDIHAHFIGASVIWKF